MAGLREQHKRSTRRALEDAALGLFARDGYEATSAGAIARAAGVTERTFFRYFATKDEVLTPDREQRQARQQLHQHHARAHCRLRAVLRGWRVFLCERGGVSSEKGVEGCEVTVDWICSSV